MNSLNEYDLKQIMSIFRTIELFEKNKIDLLGFVNCLSGLLSALGSVAKLWKDNFQSEINLLEIIQDSIDDGTISQWNGDFKEDIRQSVSKLKKMTIFILEEYLSISDSNILESAIEVNSHWFICPQCNDAWESDSLKAMVICPKCDHALHNPRAFQKTREN